MFELPEYVTLAKQINQAVIGKALEQGSLGNTPHKSVWYNRQCTRDMRPSPVESRMSHEDREDPIPGRRVLLLKASRHFNEAASDSARKLSG